MTNTNTSTIKSTIKKLGYKLGMSMAFMPLFALPAADMDIMPNAILNASSTNTEAAISIEDIRSERAAKIDAYYGRYNLPLTGYGMKMVLVAEKNGIDWNLLPAIAMRETTGGKFACYKNPFGWGSCKIKFANFDEAIEMVGKNLGGGNKKTAIYYSNNTSAQKLYYYNGTVVPSYPREVMKIMTRIENQVIDNEDTN